MNRNDDFGLWNSQCYGCDAYASVNDLGLCEDCDAKLDRDLIRQREWAYSASAFCVPHEKLEQLRTAVIQKYGEQLELIAEDKRHKSRSKKHKSKKNRQNRKS